MSIFGQNSENRSAFYDRINRFYNRNNAEEKADREKDIVRLYEGASYGRLINSTNFQTEIERKSNPFEDLRDLHKDISAYLQQLTSTEGTASSQRIVGKTYLNEQIDDLKAILGEIELFAKEKNIALDPRAISNQAEFGHKVQKVKAKVQKLGEIHHQAPAPANEFLLTRELENERKLLLLKKTDVLSAKLQKLESLVGNKEMFKSKSMCAQFEEESNNLLLIDPQEIAHIIKKLDVVVNELKRSTAERKMHYFTKEQKDDLKQFLDDFFKSGDKLYLNQIGGYVAKIVELVETNAEVINEVSEMAENLDNMRQLIEKTTAQAKENASLLSQLKDQMDINSKQIDASFKAIKR